MSDTGGGEGNLSVAVEVRYPNGAPDVRETLHATGDLLGASLGEASLGADVVAVLDPIADDITSDR